MLKTPPTGDLYLTELVRQLNAELTRKEPRVVGTRIDGSNLYLRFLAPYGIGWVQVHIQSDVVGKGGLETYSSTNYESSTEVDCRADRQQDVSVALLNGVRYAVWLIPVAYDAAGTKVLYDGASGRPDYSSSVSAEGSAPTGTGSLSTTITLSGSGWVKTIGTGAFTLATALSGSGEQLTYGPDRAFVETSTPVGTTAASLEDVSGMSVTITLKTESYVGMMASFEVETQSGAAPSTIALAVNFNSVDHLEHARYLSGSGDKGIGAIVHEVGPIAAGTYTGKLRFRRVSGAATPGINNASLLMWTTTYKS